MPFVTVCVVVIDKGSVLLTRRDDFHIWCCPSGGVEDGENLVEAAIRETKEETGLDVEITRLVGIYSRPADTPTGHAVVFAATPVGGNLCTQPGETLEVRYFAADDLPTALSFGHLRRIQDTLQGVCGGVVTQQPDEPIPHASSRNELYALRDQSGMTPEAFYMAYFKPDHVRDERLV